MGVLTGACAPMPCTTGPDSHLLSYFKDGGPIWGLQVDNETPDWRFLLALRVQ